ncbi:MAG: diaminopimelate epimerase [Nitrospirae bacterium]|nr:diaminopimelate epimerase [Nitrospirota bacterium]
MKLQFTKMHSLGNDFIVIDDRSAKLVKLPRLAKDLCSRRFGIGADQLLLLGRSGSADFKMRIFNADGSEVEMCGNGIRCLGKYIWDNKLKAQSSKLKTQMLSIETLAGTKHLEKTGELIKVDMGKPIFEPEKIPVKISSKGINKSEVRDTKYAVRIKNHPLQIADRTFKITCVSMGNPHAVIVVNDVDSFPVHSCGPLIEGHRLFPKRTNVEFIQRINSRNIKMRVWERGAGETTACGTGASASAVASSLLGLTGRRVTVHLPGGKLLIEWSGKDDHVYMTGDAVKVFEGCIEIT